MKVIPKILHQTWKNNILPDYFTALSNTWKKKHPNWKYIFWTDVENRKFIKDYFPYFLKRYDEFPFEIQRVDAVRYFILYKYGGVFVDMDFECMSNIDDLIDSNGCIFGLEPDHHCERFSRAFIICNAFMGCNANNSFFKEICNTLAKDTAKYDPNAPRWKIVLESTGPFKLTDIYSYYGNKQQIKLLPSDVLYPLTIEESHSLLSGAKLTSNLKMKILNAYAIHHFAGTWW